MGTQPSSKINIIDNRRKAFNDSKVCYRKNKNNETKSTELCPEDIHADRRLKNNTTFSRTIQESSVKKLAAKRKSKEFNRAFMTKNESIEDYKIPDEKKSIITRLTNDNPYQTEKKKNNGF